LSRSRFRTMAVTMKDIASRAQTSIATVSAVLNSPGRHNIRVSRATASRIRSIAEELGYVPNRLARSLVTGKSGVVGLVFPYAAAFTERNPFCSLVMSGVFEEAAAQQYNVMLYTAVGPNSDLLPPETLLDPRVDGLIIVIPTVNS